MDNGKSPDKFTRMGAPTSCGLALYFQTPFFASKKDSFLSQAHSGYSLYLSLIGQHEQAIAEIKRARDVDPLSLSVNQNVGFRLFLARQYDQAIEVLKKTLELDQNYPNAH